MAGKVCSVAGCENTYHCKGYCNRHYKSQYYHANKVRINAQSAANRKANPEAAKHKGRVGWSAKYERMFGWERGWHNWMLDLSFACDLCGDPFDPAVPNLKKVIDHDHGTNRFRGVIHNRCNRGIGALLDDEALCLKAAAYLRESQINPKEIVNVV